MGVRRRATGEAPLQEEGLLPSAGRQLLAAAAAAAEGASASTEGLGQALGLAGWLRCPAPVEAAGALPSSAPGVAAGPFSEVAVVVVPAGHQTRLRLRAQARLGPQEAPGRPVLVLGLPPPRGASSPRALGPQSWGLTSSGEVGPCQAEARAFPASPRQLPRGELQGPQGQARAAAD